MTRRELPEMVLCYKMLVIRKAALLLNIFIFLIGGRLSAQESIPLETLLENFESEEIGQTGFLTILQDLKKNPLNLNTATVKELLRIPFLNEEQARQIVSHRRQNGRFITRADLFNLPGLAEELLVAIFPYIRVEPPKRPVVLGYRIRLARPLHRSRGYEEDRYHNPLYVYQRMHLQPNRNLELGILWEKDSGEPHWFDFGAYFINYHWRAARSHIQVGDFNVEVGQRLVFGSAYGSPPAIGSTIALNQAPLRWQAHHSVDENAFLRGVLWDFVLTNGISLTALYSNHPLDATLNRDRTAVRSIYLSGYHRTDSEQQKRQRFREEILAGVFHKRIHSGSFGLQAANVHYSVPLIVEGDTFEKKITSLSGFYSFRKDHLLLQGEIALQGWKFPAFQQSILIQSKLPATTYGVLFYYYHPHYWAYHGRGFGGTTTPPHNETGYFLSVSTKPFPKTELAAYIHAARPARSTEAVSFLKRSWRVQIAHTFRQSRVLLRFSETVRKENSGLRLHPEEVRRTLRFHLQSDLSPDLRLSQRLEASWRRGPSQTSRKYGVSFYQDARYRISRRFLIQARWTQFDVPEFDYRLYEFENDLPGSFRNILLSNRGFKWFFLLSGTIGDHWRLSLKYREMFFPDEATLGSGLDTIRGNRKKELRVQLEVSY